MLSKYPKFKRGEVQEAFEKLPKTDKNTIEDFVKYVSITSSSKSRLENNKRVLTHLRIITNKSLDNITLQDLRDYLSLLNSSELTNASRNDFKASIKRFLRWKFKDWSERFNDLSDIRLNLRMNEEKINSNTLLKKEDIQKIMDKEPTLYWRTFFISLYESGLRPKELRTLKWKNIKLNVDGDLSEISIFATKTHRARSVYVKEATFFLKKLKERNDNPLVFPSPRDSNKPLGKSMASHWLNKTSQKILGRKVFPYLLRHTRATELYINAGIPDKIAQKFLGHSKSMADVYSHLSNKDVKEALGKTIYGLKEIPPEQKDKIKELEKKIKKLERNLDMIKIAQGKKGIRYERLKLSPEQMKSILEQVKNTKTEKI